MTVVAILSQKALLMCPYVKEMHLFIRIKPNRKTFWSPGRFWTRC